MQRETKLILYFLSLVAAIIMVNTRNEHLVFIGGSWILANAAVSFREFLNAPEA